MQPKPLLPRKPSDFYPVASIYSHITIAAPPLTVVTAVLNTSTWPTWNTYNRTAAIYDRPLTAPTTPSVKLAALLEDPNFLAPGTKFAESHSEASIKAGAAAKKDENVEVLEVGEIKEGSRNGYRVVWHLIDWNPLLMKSRRVHEFVEVDGGKGTRYECWTELGGVLAFPAKMVGIEKKIAEQFVEAFESLKKFVESETSVEEDSEGQR